MSDVITTRVATPASLAHDIQKELTGSKVHITPRMKGNSGVALHLPAVADYVCIVRS